MPSASTAWIWIPLVLWAAAMQTVRNTAQRSLTAQTGTLGATLVRFLYGLPFAVLWLLVLRALPGEAGPAAHFGGTYFFWLLLGAVAQIAATAFLLAAMRERNFVIGVAFSKTEVLQVVLFGLVFLHELPGHVALAAMVVATLGLVLLSMQGAQAGGWNARAAMFGLASGAGFALSAIGYRGAALQVPELSPWMAGAWGVVWAQAAQSLLLGGWLALRSPATMGAVARAWRVSLAAGLAGALASIAWFTAFALHSAAEVRTLGLVEVFFSYLVSRRLLREELSRREKIGLGLVLLGLVGLCLQA
ncbi:DMT family transporter [Variovorax sp. KK3]|uniref:DMT family transporter n=1 Tax=Variovorax sp. KK3 TaxID=1855728 RepID=UPI00097C42B7|nr:DMT family transporter [Variovorax sp. KK3]